MGNEGGGFSAFGDGPVVEVKGKRFKLRRLAAKDVWRFTGLLARTSRFAGDKESLALAAGYLLAEGFANEELIEWLADLVGTTPQELGAEDPEVVPALLEALARHQDMAAFFDVCVRAAKAAVSLFAKPST